MSTQAIRRSVRYGMSTVITHGVYGTGAEQALAAAEKETDRLERLLSRFLPGSDVWRINQNAGREPVSVESETMEILKKAVWLAELSRGAFDITIAPLSDIWRAAGQDKAVPDGAAIRRALSFVDYSNLKLDQHAMTAFLPRAGQAVDLGGIAKGVAAGRVLDVFRAYGVASAYTDFGGNVATLGTKPGGAPWTVGIRHPRCEGSIIGTLSVADRSVVTSGDYQRCFLTPAGQRYHHILDVKTGYPTDNGLISVTVISACPLTADALSTALFAAGLEKGARLLKKIPEAHAVFIDTRLNVFISQGLIGNFQSAGQPVKILSF